MLVFVFCEFALLNMVSHFYSCASLTFRAHTKSNRKSWLAFFSHDPKKKAWYCARLPEMQAGFFQPRFLSHASPKVTHAKLLWGSALAGFPPAFGWREKGASTKTKKPARKIELNNLLKVAIFGPAEALVTPASRFHL